VEKFLVAFARALQKHAMYPPGHPALEPAARALTGALRRATEERERVELSVAPDRIGVGEAATDPEADLFSSLARRLHRHHLSVITLEADAGEEEIDTLLEALALEPDEDSAAGLRFDGMLPGCPHVQVQPVPYAAMRLAEESEEVKERARSLWFQLARVAQGVDPDADEDAVSLEPEAVARAMADGSREGREEYAEAVLESVSDAARLFRDTERREGESALGSLSDQMSTLVQELPPETFVELLENGGSPEQARQILFDVSFQLEPGAMEKILDAVADVRFVEISGWLHRIFGKLGSHARSEDTSVREEADDHMREQIREMVGRWELENPNPTEYEEALSRLAVQGGDEGTSHLGKAEPLRMIRMGLEVDTGGEWLSGAVSEVREVEERSVLIRDLVETPSGVGAADDAWRGATRPEWIRDFFEPPVPETALVEAFLARLDVEHAGVLLDVLADSDARSVRRAIFDRLVEMGDEVGPAVIERLDDDRWYIRRNLLALLNEMEELPPDFDPRRFLDEEHPEVRHEAISLALRSPGSRADAIRNALDDPHSRTVIMGLTALRQDCPPELVPRVVTAAGDEDLSWTVRVHAIRALGGMDETDARDALLSLVTRRDWPWFWRRRIREPTDSVIEGLRVLRKGWDDDAAVRRVLERAREAESGAIRKAADGGSDEGGER
jgi:HEAT repeat protein